MRAALLLLLLVGASCTLDPRQVLEEAALRVQVEGIPPQGNTLVVTARDSAAKQLVKRAPLAGQTSLELVFEKGTLTDGALDLGGVVLSADGGQLACGAAQGEGTGSSVVLALTLANDDANCGACGRTCEGADHATRTCVRALATCGALTCTSGWFDVNGDPLDGCETTCAAPTPETSLTACRDGVDNDCDLKTDCLDEGCAGFTRPCSVMSCTGEQRWDCATDTWGACIPNSGQENDLAACRDGVDNDCDLKTDCLDEGCASFTRPCSFMSCTGEQRWDCATDTWGACTASSSVENDAATCTDGLDNDCDGKTDCLDENCNGLSRACTQLTCAGQQEWTCSTNTWSACAVDPALEATPASCSDGQDNDCDSKSDCQDPECLNIKQGCGGNLCAAGVKTWLCSVQLYSLCVPYVSLPEDSDLLCGDNLDNDCDQLTDCADANCAGKKCGLGKVCCPDKRCAASCN